MDYSFHALQSNHPRGFFGSNTAWSLASSMASSMIRLCQIWPILCALVIPITTVEGQNTDENRKIQSLYSEARSLESQLIFDEAFSIYQEILTLKSTSRIYGKAKTRANWLEKRMDGNWIPLRELRRMQTRQPLKAEDLDGFEQKVQNFPTSLIKRESLRFLAMTWEQLKNHTKAIENYEAWLAEPGIERQESVEAAKGLAKAFTWLGKSREAESVLLKYQINPSGFLQEAQRVKNTPIKKIFSWVLLALTFFIGFFAGVMPLIKSPSKLRNFPLLRWILGMALLFVPTIIARLYDAEAAEPFLKLFIGSVFLWTCTLVVRLGTATVNKQNPRRKLLKNLMLSFTLLTAHLALGYLVLEDAGKSLSFKF